MLKGQTVIVAGKFDKNDDYYIDLYFDLFPESKVQPTKTIQVVNINGVRQKLFLWQNDTLKNIQLEQMRQILEQSCGRPRALREKFATAYIFANFLIAGSDEIID